VRAVRWVGVVIDLAWGVARAGRRGRHPALRARDAGDGAAATSVHRDVVRSRTLVVWGALLRHEARGRALPYRRVENQTKLERALGLLPRLLAVTDALAYAHDRRVIHLDLEPSNVLVGAFGETVVIDWGLAKVCGTPEAESSESGLSDLGSPEALTEVGVALGTPAYMPPEQVRGQAADERATAKLGAAPSRRRRGRGCGHSRRRAVAHSSSAPSAAPPPRCSLTSCPLEPTKQASTPRFSSAPIGNIGVAQAPLSPVLVMD
jgi:hypothetical protein